jgi:hypothetical protein
MFRFSCGAYTISLADSLPPKYYSYCQHARLVDTIELEGAFGSLCYLAVARGFEYPTLIVAQRYSPGPQSGFYPGVLYIPETDLLLLGAGERILAYTLDPARKLWQYNLVSGFQHWERWQDRIIMASENELAVFDIHGLKRWDFTVEPPWNYTLEGDTLHVYMNGKQTALHCERGIVIEGSMVES